MWTAPSFSLVVRLQQNLELRNSMCCFPKYTHSHTDTCVRSQCDGRMTSAAVAAGQSALWTFKPVYNLLWIWLQFVNNGDVGVDVYTGNRRRQAVGGIPEQMILTTTYKKKNYFGKWQGPSGSLVVNIRISSWWRTLVYTLESRCLSYLIFFSIHLNERV